MQTINYDLFKFKSNNRKISESNINRLKKSIQEIGYLNSKPITVDKNLFIIDGQHRFEACKRLQLPVLYVIETFIDGDRAMVNLNANQSIWRLSEYIESYAEQGIYCYVVLRDFETKYKLGSSNNIIILLGSGFAKRIREGKNLTINPKAEKIVEFILSAKESIPFALTAKFVTSVTRLHEVANSGDISKVLYSIQSLKQMANTTDYLIAFENMINKGRHTSNKISLIV